jgi:hypothetical protein
MISGTVCGVTSEYIHTSSSVRMNYQTSCENKLIILVDTGWRNHRWVLGVTSEIMVYLVEVSLIDIPVEHQRFTKASTFRELSQLYVILASTQMKTHSGVARTPRGRMSPHPSALEQGTAGAPPDRRHILRTRLLRQRPIFSEKSPG